MLRERVRTALSSSVPRSLPWTAPRKASGGGQPVAFAISGDTLVEGGKVLEVAGFAANLYAHAGLRRDSRGFGVAAAAVDGARAVKVRKWDTPAKIVETALSLFTMPAAQSIEGLADKGAWGFRAPLQVFARDLPLGQSVFDGKATPVEAAIGAQGHQRDRTRNSVDADYRHRQELPRQSHRPSPDHIARRTRA